MTEKTAKRIGHRFQKGNQYAVGNPGPSPRTKFLTQELISQLNQTTKHATVITYWVKDKRGKLVKKRALAENERTNIAHLISCLIANAKEGDLTAIKEIFDRVEGRAVQAMENTGTSPITLHFYPEDERV